MIIDQWPLSVWLRKLYIIHESEIANFKNIETSRCEWKIFLVDFEEKNDFLLFFEFVKQIFFWKKQMSFAWIEYD